MARGIWRYTWTGHVGGFEAIVQILLIYAALFVAITAIGIISIMVS